MMEGPSQDNPASASALQSFLTAAQLKPAALFSSHGKEQLMTSHYSWPFVTVTDVQQWAIGGGGWGGAVARLIREGLSHTLNHAH